MNSTYRPLASIEPTAAEIAEWTGGELLEGDRAPDKLTAMATLEDAGNTEIAFVTDPKWIKKANDSKAGLLLVPRGSGLGGRACVAVDHVWSAVVETLHRLYPEPRPKPGIHPTATIAEDAQIGEQVSIGAGCVIESGATIGDGVVLGPLCAIGAGSSVGEGSRFHSHVTLQGAVVVGRNVILHSGVTLGVDGFRYEATPAGPLKIPQVGRVVIEDDVEIGANSAVDRAFLNETRIGQGTKIDNLVQIGHNCIIGKYCIICGCVAMAGSCVIEDGVILGGAVALRDGVRVGAGSMVGGRAGIHRDVPPGSVVGGYPLVPMREHLKIQSQITRLPDIAKRLKEVERALEAASAEAGRRKG